MVIYFYRQNNRTVSLFFPPPISSPWRSHLTHQARRVTEHGTISHDWNIRGGQSSSNLVSSWKVAYPNNFSSRSVGSYMVQPSNCLPLRRLLVVTQRHTQPTPISLPLLDLHMAQTAEWTSPHWISQFIAITYQAAMKRFHTFTLKCNVRQPFPLSE